MQNANSLVRISLMVNSRFPEIIPTELKPNAALCSIPSVDECLQRGNCNNKKCERQQKNPSFVTLLKDCVRKKNISEGKRLHVEILKRGLLEKGPLIGGMLVSMYARCGMLAKAAQVFEELPVRDVISWNTLISGYIQQGQNSEALKCFELMQNEGFCPSDVTFICILKACGSIKAINEGTKIHDEIVNRGLLDKNIALGNSLIDMYAKCGALTKAREVLDQLPIRDIVSWNSLISGYAQQGRGEEALHNFERMKNEGFSPDAITFTCVLKACASIRDVVKGTKIHEEISCDGLLEKNMAVGNALVDMYAKCGVLVKAQSVFDELPARDVISWNALISGYTQQRQGYKSLQIFDQMQREGFTPDAFTFTCVLKACGITGAIDKGAQIHETIISRVLLRKSTALGNALLDMYAQCDHPEKAQEVFDRIHVPDVVSWSTLISGYVRQGRNREALKCFQEMCKDGFSPNEITFIFILKACSDMKAVEIGKQIHDNIRNSGLLQKNIELGNALVSMYAQCGLLTEAQEVLEDIPIRDIISWNVLIAGYVQWDKAFQAISCFEKIHIEGLTPNEGTFMCVLKACRNRGALETGEKIHKETIRRGLLKKDIVLGTALLHMYASCGALLKAKQVLNELPIRELKSWNTLIAGYSELGLYHEAVQCLEWMKIEGHSPDSVTFTCILKACRSIGALDKGREIHFEIANKGLLEKDIMLGSALVGMYSHCGVLAKAQEVHDELPFRDLVCWSTLISGYVQQGYCYVAFNCYEMMQMEGLLPNGVTFLSILRACSNTQDIEKGKDIHNEIINMGLLKKNSILGNALVDMYAKCGALEKAHEVLNQLCIQDVVSWTALIAGYAEQGHTHEVLECLEMMQREGFCPNEVTFLSVLKACDNVDVICKTSQFLKDVLNQWLIKRDVMLGTALVNMYVKCGMFAKAQEMHEEFSGKDAVSWSALISGYTQQEHNHKALECFQRMRDEGVIPDVITFTSILKACGNIGALDMGKKIHDEIVQKDLLAKDIVLATAIMDMYIKCGWLAKAHEVHEELPVRDVISWNTLLAGYAKNKKYEVINCFHQMQSENICPDSVTFVCLLIALSHLEKLDEAQTCFENMSRIYGITPNSKHHICIVNSFGNAGNFNKALYMMRTGNFEDPIVWMAVLDASKRWGNVKLGKLAFDQVVLLDSN